MMNWYGSGMSGGAWLLMGLLWLVLIAAIVILVALLLPRSAPTSRRPDTPEEILDRRFAQGEIDAEAYQSQRTALTAARRGPK